MPKFVRLLPIVGLIAWLLVTVPVSAQVTSLTVTPNTGLVVGQNVELAGEGEPGSFSALGACDAASDFSSLASALPTCELIGFALTGAFDITWPATRVLTTPSGPIDCAVTACVISFGGGDTSNVLFVETVPISFAPAPLVTIAPTTLADLGSATISVAGTTADQTVTMIQCTSETPVSAASPPGACVDHGPAVPVAGGHAGAIAAVPRWIDDTNGYPTDCAAFPNCAVGVRVTNNGVDSYVFGPVSFTSRLRATLSHPHDDAGIVVFEPVHENDRLELSIDNIDQFGPGLGVAFCHGNIDIGPDLSTCGPVGINPIVGVTSFTGSFPLPASFVGGNGITYDCTDLAFFDACFPVILGYREPGPSDPFVLQTLADFLDVRARSFVATPTTELQDGDVVTIMASVGPHEDGGAAVPAQCGFATPDFAGFRCVAGIDVDSAFDGEYGGSITVQREFVSAGDTIDCSVSVCAVVLAVLGADGLPIAIPGSTISFAPEP